MWIVYGVCRCGSTAKPRLEGALPVPTALEGVKGNVAEVGGLKNGAPAFGRPVQPVFEHVAEKRGAVASVIWVDGLISAVAVPGEPFWSASTASASPTRS